MSLYYFDVRDRAAMPDDTGTELASVADARVQAVQFAGKLLAEKAEEFLNGDKWQIEVRHADGLILFTFAFMATDAPYDLKLKPS